MNVCLDMRDKEKMHVLVSNFLKKLFFPGPCQFIT